MGTPWWQTFLSAAFGGLVTLAGVYVAQHLSDRREAANRKDDRERERERWKREDEARTFEQRQAAYLDLWVSLREQKWVLGAGPEEGTRWHAVILPKLRRLMVYATPDIRKAADDVFVAALRCIFRPIEDVQRDNLEQKLWTSENVLLDLIRRALNIPEE